MMDLPLPMTRDIVLIGGGHSHALVLRKWGMAPLAGARLTLINPGPTAPYSGMLPGHVAGHYPRAALDIDLVQLARFAGARLILGAATGLDSAAKRVHVEGRPPVGYDLCSIDVGVTSAMPDLPGFAEHAIPAKPLGPFADAWARYLSGTGRADVVVIGGGVAGVELAMAMAHALAGRARPARISIVERDHALAAVRPASARRLRQRLAAMQISLIEQAAISAIEADRVLLDDGSERAAGFVVGTAGARAHDWLQGAGLDLCDGFVRVGPTLQSSRPDVLAVGDCAHLDHAPRAKAGVFAVRQAPVLLHNLRALAAQGRLRRYQPQNDYLKLISLGQKSALGERFGRPVAGPVVWRLKDRIDRTFMEKFRDLPRMGAQPLPRQRTAGMEEALGDKPLCGGCGAKVGRNALAPLIVDAPNNSDRVEMLPGDDAAVLRCADSRLVISTDHLRAFTEDPVAMTTIAANHALGDIWAMGAQPLAATINLILPPMSADLRDRTLTEIMQAARATMAQAGADIAGGHTSIGAELTIGFTVTGTVADRPVTLAGARPGDALILTKAIGSGVILAAEMQGAARGDWVAGAFASMQRPQGCAAGLLSTAHAMTDVTGFGLAGHLDGICAASGAGALLDLSAIPLLDGAIALSEAGYRSSLYAENRALTPDLPESGAAALLYDPQTAGGLLAAVPAAVCDEKLRALQQAGYPAARIGRIVDGPPRLRLAP